LSDVAEAIVKAGGQATPIPADLSSEAGIAKVKAAVDKEMGSPSILVNAAGVFGPIQLISESDPQLWIETLQINTVAPYLMCRAFVADMISAGWGRIVNFSSAAALHPPGPLNSAYATSKVALNQFTRQLAVELAGTGVTANVIHPGEVKTKMWADIRDQANQMGPIAEDYREWVRWVDESGGDPPEKAAELVARLIAPESDNISGQFLWIEDGMQTPIASWETSGD
jgi:NAD(P)-dependent dehydrogenase (short-subunit alcohol dehydrogenase family)